MVPESQTERPPEIEATATTRTHSSLPKWHTDRSSQAASESAEQPGNTGTARCTSQGRSALLQSAAIFAPQPRPEVDTP